MASLAAHATDPDLGDHLTFARYGPGLAWLAVAADGGLSGTPTVADLGLDAGQVGAPGSRQEVTALAAAEERKAGEIVVDEGDAHEQIVRFLEQLKLV